MDLSGLPGLPDLPVGISDFRKLVEYRNNYTNRPYLYVDKTKFIIDIDSDGAEVIIITRPRRFGKTLNMSMLEYFYSPQVGGKETAGLFENLEISNNQRAMAQQGQWPTLFISFKDIEGDTLDESLTALSRLIKKLFYKHEYLLYSDKLSQYDKIEIKKVFDADVLAKEQIKVALLDLSEFLAKHYSKEVILLIDEYDAPIQKAYSKNYYEEIIAIFRGMFGTALKGNNAVKKAVLTGILRISKESLFSTLNNVKVYSVLHSRYSEYFGFVESEVALLLKSQGVGDIAAAKEWYNGYKFANNVVYNPWSIINYLSDDCELKSYWINTSSNRLAENLLLQSSPITKQKIEKLIAGETIQVLVDEHVVFKDLDTDESSLWSLLLASGYLMSIKKSSEGRFYRCELKIPNKEVLDFYLSTVKVWIANAGGITWFEEFVADLTSGNAQKIQNKIQDIIDNTMSYHDRAKNIYESYFHGLMLGVVAGLKDDYIIKSNRESGMGRYDVALFPKDKNRPGIVMEFKTIDSDNDAKATELAKIALQQLSDQDYSRELKDAGVSSIISLGIGFTRDKVCVLES